MKYLLKVLHIFREACIRVPFTLYLFDKFSNLSFLPTSLFFQQFFKF